MNLRDDAAVLTRIRALDPWFHDIDLGPALPTKLRQCADEPLDHPRPTWALVRRHLPADLTGRSVLDVGCNAGFYSFELKRLGAGTVLGVDSQRREVAQARLAARILNLDVAFRRCSAYDLSVVDPGQFDIVLALGLLYHCRHPLLALERLAEVTRRTLLVESAVIPESMSAAPRDFVLGNLVRHAEVAYYIQNESNAKEAVLNWFWPSASCLESLLRSVGFESVEHVPVSSDRSLFVCSREPIAGDDGTYRCRFDRPAGVALGPASPGELLSATIRVWNVGSATWAVSAGRETEPGSVLLGVHLLDPDSNVLAWDFRAFRGALPAPVGFGEYVDLAVRIEAPETPGVYFLEFDLVREFLGWFEDMGGETLKVPLVVGNSGHGIASHAAGV